mgnify:CR=1 FL=1
MSDSAAKTFEKPDEVRHFEGKGHIDVVTVAGRRIGRFVLEPGWRWSANVKPIAGTDSCQVFHLGYCVSGRMRITMDDGATVQIGAGDVAMIEPGHDAEVVGDEVCVIVDFGEVEQYAKRE